MSSRMSRRDVFKLAGLGALSMALGEKAGGQDVGAVKAAAPYTLPESRGAPAPLKATSACTYAAALPNWSGCCAFITTSTTPVM